jgi:hypothetical protein
MGVLLSSEKVSYLHNLCSDYFCLGRWRTFKVGQHTTLLNQRFRHRSLTKHV